MTYEGKTVARVVDRSSGYDGIDIHFTDGSVLRVEGNGYDDSTVTQIDLTPADLRREVAEKQGERESARVRDLAREVRRREDAALKASMTPAEWDAWRDKNRPGWRFAQMMSDEIKGAYADMMRSHRRVLLDQPPMMGLAAIIPTFEREGESS